MEKGQIFKDSKGNEFEFVVIAGKSIIGKKSNGQCAYMFSESKSGILKGLRVPQSLVSL